MSLTPLFVHATAGALCVGLAACAQAGPDAGRPVYRGVETRLLDGDLVNFHAALTGSGEAATDEAAAVEYSTCAAAQYAVIRGYGFARHVRTTTELNGGVWRADAVYTISPALPSGLRTIDAEVTVADCAERGIPTV
ncbi:hypothetical protein [Albirhodobacter sp. R86504]|uniref:hypothetical protein n=1 Tax=Albirhodobacter sp. R86504 TaxID=3093848 RepID=UPI003670B3A0